MDYNLNVSSELFVSILYVFHEMLPCSSTVFRLKRQRKAKTGDSPSSPCKKIASPRFIKSGSFSPSGSKKSSLNSKKKTFNFTTAIEE